MRNPRVLRRALAGGWLLIAAGVVSLPAQAVRGTVVMPDGSTPAAGVIVVFETAKGAVVQRAITGERGTFTAKFTAGGDYRTRALRVGYRPTDVPTVRVAANGTTELRIVLAASPV